VIIVDGLAFGAKGWANPITIVNEDIPQDPALRDLEQFLDARTMAGIWERDSSFDRPKSHALHSCQIVFIRYKLGRYCNLFYHLHWQSKSGATSLHQLVSGKVVGRRLSKRSARKDKVLQLTKPSVNELHYTLFPQDSKIASLNVLATRQAMESCLRDATGEDYQIVTSRSSNSYWGQVLSYRPERYCMLRFSAQGVDGKHRDIMARVFHDKAQGEHSWRLMRSMWTTVHGSSVAPVIAQPLGQNQDASVCFYAVVPGVPLTNHAQTIAPSETFNTAANVLARIHTHKLVANLAADLPVRNMATQLASLQSLQDATKSVRNIDGDTLALAVHKLQTSVIPNDNDQHLLHGDFSTNQIMTDGSTHTALDLSAVRGNIHLDIGNYFCASQQSR